MNAQTSWAIDRLREPSTWKGLSVLVGALGIGLAPELVIQIGTIVGSIVGLIDMLRQEA